MKRFGIIAVLVFALFGASFILFKALSPATSIAIQPFGSFSNDQQLQVKNALEKQYGMSVSILEPIDLPKSAYYQARNRYRADSIIAFLKRNVAIEHQKVIGLTHFDISTTKGEHKDWGVMGLGYCPGRSCVVSSHRIAHQDSSIFRQRLQKVAIHEVGHSLGLPHCSHSETCVMNDAKGSVKEVDDNDFAPCNQCKKKLNNYWKW